MDGQSPKLRHVPVVAKLVIGAVLVVVVVGILLILIVLSYGTSEHGGIGLVIGGSVLLVFVVILFIRRKRTHQRQPKPRDDSGSAGLPQQRQHIAASQRNNVVDLVVEPSSPLYVATNPLLPLSMNQRSGSEKLIPQPEAKMDFNFSMNTFTYEQLALATEDFSDANLLGRGGFGYVHKGILPNGKIVAIKQLIVGSAQGEREFRAEVEIISRVHHKHLVSLLGYCVAGSQRMLVYEFVPNNTLDFQLHGKGHTCINWATRMKVALGSAKGLAYLHEDCQPKIIHRDIKAANILLDSNFEPKVADFGLARFFADTDTHVSTRIMGTVGYLAPEYAQSGQLTDKSDVFSFGVMLLELITGRLPSVKVQNLDLTFIDWARPLLSQAVEDGNFDTLADPRLQNNYDFMEMARMVACASVCVRHSARRRPRMSQIVRALEGIIPLEDLNDGIKPGNSTLYGSAGSANYGASQYKEDLKKFQRIAFEGQEENSSG